jgi:hypothetical protein
MSVSPPPCCVRVCACVVQGAQVDATEPQAPGGGPRGPQVLHRVHGQNPAGMSAVVACRISCRTSASCLMMMMVVVVMMMMMIAGFSLYRPNPAVRHAPVPHLPGPLLRRLLEEVPCARQQARAHVQGPGPQPPHRPQAAVRLGGVLGSERTGHVLLQCADRGGLLDDA